MASAYKYLPRGIREFPSAEALAAEMAALGFEEVSFERLSLGIVAIHTARTPRAKHNRRDVNDREEVKP